MKTITTLTVIAALFSAVPLASAQTPTTKVAPSPGNINKGSRPTVPSGTEAPSAAAGKPQHVSGTAKFCTVRSANGTLRCHYASMSTCRKHNKGNSLHCVSNPHLGA